MKKPSLFGIKNSNRDFSKEDSWGKNQFNSSFPAYLCAYMEYHSFDINYITTKYDKIEIKKISVEKLFGITTLIHDNIFYAFEAQYSPYNTYIKGSLPRTDLVLQDLSSKACMRGLEVKLTAIPDQSTFSKPKESYGCEIVIRPDTIVYLACSLIESINESNIELKDYLKVNVSNWESPEEVIKVSSELLGSLRRLYSCIEIDNPILLQPIWRTDGKLPVLSDSCLDVFAWSNTGFTKFIHDIAFPITTAKSSKVTRQYRTCVWLYKMLKDYLNEKSFDHEVIIDKLSYNLKNDKAFSCAGNQTNKFMACDSLLHPRIKKSEIKNIILGNGQRLLSPERRFDAIIFNSPDLFR